MALEIHATETGGSVMQKKFPGMAPWVLSLVRLVGGKQVPSGACTPVSNPGVLKRLAPSARDSVLQADLRSVRIGDYRSV